MNNRVPSRLWNKSCLDNLNFQHFDTQEEGVFRQKYPHAEKIRTETIRNKKNDKNYIPTFAEIVCGYDDTEHMVYSNKGHTYRKYIRGEKLSYRQQKEINKEFRDLMA